jgi:hypothetical protein
MMPLLSIASVFPSLPIHQNASDDARLVLVDCCCFLDLWKYFTVHLIVVVVVTLLRFIAVLHSSLISYSTMGLFLFFLFTVRNSAPSRCLLDPVI